MTPAERTIARFLDGDMSAAEVNRFLRDLDHTPSLRATFDEMRAIRAGARRLPVFHAPSSLTEAALFARLRAEGFQGTFQLQPSRRYRKIAIASLAGMMLLVIVVSRIVLAPPGGAPFVAHLPVAYGSASSKFEMPLPGVPALEHREAVRAAQVLQYRHPSNRSNRTESAIDGDAGAVTLPFADVVEPADPSATDGGDDAGHNINDDTRRPVMTETVAAHRDADTVMMPGDQTSLRVPSSVHRSARVLASIQGGMSQIYRGEWLAVRDIQIRIGMETWSGGSVSLVVGSYPAVTETKHTNTNFMLTSAAGSARTTTTSLPRTHSILLADEAWAGVAVRQNLLEVGGFDLHAGASLGSSRSSLRVAGEIGIERMLLPGVAIDAGGALMQTLPYDQSVSQYQVFDSPDHFVYNGVSQRPAFYSIGLQAGVRVELGR